MLISYQYDVSGIRVASIVDGVETRYLIDANRPHAQVLEEYSPDGEVEVAYFYGNDLIAQSRGEEELYYLYDGHSGVRQLSDGAGIATDSYNYDAYGNLLQSTGDSSNNYLYRGEQHDPNLGMQYLRARYYYLDAGRFASVDPFEGVQEQPITRHRYLYGNDNPITYIDPSGRFSLTETITATKTITTLSVIDIGLIGLSSLGLAQRVAGFMYRGDGKITWDGEFGGIALGVLGRVVAASAAAFTSEELGRGPAGDATLTGYWWILSAGAALGPLPIGVTLSFAKLKSPWEVGVNLGALSGGLLLGTASVSTSVFGYGASVITMGFGQGYGHGYFLGYDIGVTIMTGVSIPVWREWNYKDRSNLPSS